MQYSDRLQGKKKERMNKRDEKKKKKIHKRMKDKKLTHTNVARAPYVLV